MFSITVENVFKISTRKGMTVVGKTSGDIKIGDYLIDNTHVNRKYKVIGLDMIRFSDIEKRLTHNPAIMIDADCFDLTELKGKTLLCCADF